MLTMMMKIMPMMMMMMTMMMMMMLMCVRLCKTTVRCREQGRQDHLHGIRQT